MKIKNQFIFTKALTLDIKLTSLQLERISSSLPGVATIILAPFTSLIISSSIVVPPTSNTCFKLGIWFKKLASTSLICVASSLVGDITMPPISNFFQFSSRF